MESLEWRLQKLELKVIGQVPNAIHQNRLLLEDKPIVDQLNQLASNYKHFAQQDYLRFSDMYRKLKPMIEETRESQLVSVSAKADRVLAYEKELVKHMEDVNYIVDKSEKVLNIDNWPDLTMVDQRLDNLTKTTHEQYASAASMDKKFEELLDIYNDINTSFRASQVSWNQKLEAHEEAENELQDD